MGNSFLDTRTLAFVLVPVTIILSAVMVFVWRKHKTYPGFGFWAISNLTAAVGFALVIFRGTLPDLVTILIANALVFGSLLLALEGIRRFRGLPSRRLFSGGTITLQILLFTYFTYVNGNLPARIIIISIMSALVCTLCAFELMRGVSKRIRYAYFQVGIIFGLSAVSSVIRAILTYSYTDGADFFMPDWVQALSFITAILFAVAWAFSYLILNSERTQHELRSTQAELEELAATDFLTGVNNNRRFFEVGRDEVRLTRKALGSLTLIILDIDYFKRINDTFGHAAGDKVLKNVIDVCRQNLRETDTLARLGGEEFVALLPRTDIRTGLAIADRLRRSIEDAEVALGSERIRVTASFGVSELLADDEEIETILERADNALYAAKRQGRNQVVLESSMETKEFMPIVYAH